jgi:4-hydroxy-tetrahydrodipicolinate synthase
LIQQRFEQLKYSKTKAKEYAKKSFAASSSRSACGDAGLRHDIRHYIEVIRSGGLYVHGFYVNFWLLTTAERKRVMEIVAEENRGQMPIILRVAHQSVKETIVCR